MKVCLIQPPHYFMGHSRTPNYFPIGLGYVASCLVAAGHDVQVFDIWAHQYTDSEVVEKIQKLEYDVVGISALSTQYKYVKWLIGELKKHSSNLVVVGNALACFSSGIVLDTTQADVCVMGEGEATFKDILDHLDCLEEVRGICFKKNGVVIRTLPRENIKDIDMVGFPAWSLFPMDIYLKNCTLYHSLMPAVNVVTSRGCPYNCGFCSKTLDGFRLRSVDSVVEEIKVLKKKYGVHGVVFNDELCISSKKRGYELCRKIKPLGVEWQCQGRANIVDLDLLKAMKDSGCSMVGFGIESGSQRILDSMKKQVKVKQNIQAVYDALKAGLFVRIQLMYGYVGEDKASTLETIRYFSRIPFVERLGLGVATPLPGSFLYEYAVGHGLISDEVEFLDNLESGFCGGYSKNFVNLSRFADKEFFCMRKDTENKLFLVQVLCHPLSFVCRVMQDLVSYRVRHRFGVGLWK